MKVMVKIEHGDCDMLEWHEYWPALTDVVVEVLIKLGACGLNNIDINTRTGWYSQRWPTRPPPARHIMRLEAMILRGAALPLSSQGSKEQISVAQSLPWNMVLIRHALANG